MRVFRRALLGLVAVMALALPAQAQMSVSGMDDAEREALHQEIRDYLLANPEILMEMYALLEERQRAAEAETGTALVSENSAAIFEDGFSHVGGNPEGDFTIVEFMDYQCGYCRRAHPELAGLIEADGNIRWIIKEFPILGPNSETAARAAISTLMQEGDVAYAQLHDAMMEASGPVTDQNLDAVLQANGLDPDEIRSGMDAPEVTERIAATRALAETLQISGTPTFVFDDELVRGYVPLQQMEALVAEKRADE
jgi:protein-disulfide isomerase